MNYTFAVLLAFFMLNTITASATVIEQCWAKQARELKNNSCLSLSVKETANRFYHSFEPWQKLTTESWGTIYFTDSVLAKADSMSRKDKLYTSKLKYSPADLLIQGFGSEKLSEVTLTEFKNYLFETCRYTPAFILSYFYNNRKQVTENTDEKKYRASMTIHNSTVTVHINLEDTLVNKITILSYDGLYGDILSTYTYSDYESLNTLSFPKKIAIEKINEKLKDEVTLSAPQIINAIPDLLQRPTDFKWAAEENDETEITVEKYNSHIYFLYLKQPDTKSLLVEFDDFLLVAEAPLSIANGKLIIDEVKKLIPGKPIKYFAYGHFHNWYLGGIRPFVHEGCTVLARPESKEYVEFIVNATHNQNPDDLQKDPKKLKLQVIKDSLTIKDSNYEMRMYVIGSLSDHTSDFMIYYFPEEKLLFEDDLIWIKNEGELKKASKRQEGLYNAVNNLGLDVSTIIQAWPVTGYNVKNIIPFEELKQSVNTK